MDSSAMDNELLSKAIPAKEEGRDRRAMESQAESAGKPGLWEARHWKGWPAGKEALAAATEQASPAPGTIVPHMPEALALTCSEVLIFCFDKEVAISCKLFTVFLLLLDVSLSKKSSSEKVIVSAKHNKRSLGKQTQCGHWHAVHTHILLKSQDHRLSLIIVPSLFPCVSLECHASITRRCQFIPYR